MNDNNIILDGINKKKLNFKNLLTIKDSIIWKNCTNLSIQVLNKVNKIVFHKCKDIKIKVGDTISGLELSNCNDIEINIIKNKNIKLIDSYNSNIKIKLEKK